jgi:hypothetical protein
MGVRRKAAIIGTLAILLTAATAGRSPNCSPIASPIYGSPIFGRAVTSVRTFKQNFGELKKAESMSPIERFVFSLILSNAKTPTTDTNIDARPLGQT